MTRPDQLAAAGRGAGIAVTPQASFFLDGGDGMTASLGPERLGWAYRAASFLAAGVTLAGSSDRPVADGNVLRGMQAFVDRRTASGAVFGNPDERLSPLPGPGGVHHRGRRGHRRLARSRAPWRRESSPTSPSSPAPR